MSLNKEKISFWNLIKQYDLVIPIIQRDYAQGRDKMEFLRQKFLIDLKQALDNKHHLTLDFVYGTLTSTNKMNPLDGQQRLTTLWLLHWYIAYKIGRLEEVKATLKKFSYETRASSREFCIQLCELQPLSSEATSFLQYIQQQTWFFSMWKQDPTIQAMLRMICGTKKDDPKTNEDIIDGLDEMFGHCSTETLETYWQRLTCEVSADCPITFYHMPIGQQELPLSDDLYIKMNARGKPLTSFENFKADLLKWIADTISLEESVRYASLIDNQWTDVFWDASGRDTAHSVDEIFFAFINRYFYNLAVIQKNGNTDNNKAIKYFNNTDHPRDLPSPIAYQLFDYYEKYLTVDVLEDLSAIFRNLRQLQLRSKNHSIFSPKWNPDFYLIPHYKIDTNNQLSKIKDSAGNEISDFTAINQQERVAFYAFCKYLVQDPAEEDEEESLSHWNRVVWNLISEKDGDKAAIRSVDAMQSAISYIDRIQNTHCAYHKMAGMEIAPEEKSALGNRFNEEIEKVKQILHPEPMDEYSQILDSRRCEEKLVAAEQYGFFEGAINFLYKNTDGKLDWKNFTTKFKNAQERIPEKVGDRQTIQLLIPYLSESDLVIIFQNLLLSNTNDNLLKLLLRYPRKLHEFFMKSPSWVQPIQTPLHSDLLYHSKKHPTYWINPKWKADFSVPEENKQRIKNNEQPYYVLTNYKTKSGDYDYYSFFVGTSPILSRVELLQQVNELGGCIITDFLKNNQIDKSEIYIYQGLYFCFGYKYHDYDYQFRWNFSGWIDMYDNNENLWRKGLHTLYMGGPNHPRFSDASTLKDELERCCEQYEKYKE